MTKEKTEESKSPFMAVDAISEDDIPKKGGREPAFDWDEVFGQVKPGTAQEVDPKTVSKGTLISASKEYNAKHDTDIRVVGRKVGDKERVWIRNPAPDEDEATE